MAMSLQRWIAAVGLVLASWAWSPASASERIRQELTERLVESIEAQLGWPGSEIEVGPLEVIGPMPARGWSLQLRSGRLEGVVQAEVLGESREAGQGRTWVRAAVEILVPVYRAAEIVEGGEGVNGRYRREMVRYAGLPRDTIMEQGEFRGQTAKRRIREGEVLTRGLFEYPRVIERNDLVEVVVRRGAIMVSLRAQALQSGRVGDTIRVRNLDSDESLMGIVRDARTVEVP